MELDFGSDGVSIGADFFHSTILDSRLTVADKLTRMSEVIADGLDLGLDLGRTPSPSLGNAFPLLLAVNLGDADLVEFLVRRGGADVNQSLDGEDFPGGFCPTALHQACLDGRQDLVRVLVSTPHGPLNLESTNSMGQTPLHLAVESGNTDLVRYLVEEVGCRVDACDRSGNNALHVIARVGCPDPEGREMVEALVGLGVSVVERNRLGFSPVRMAMLLGRETVARAMLLSTGKGQAKELVQVVFHPLEAAVVDRKRKCIASILDRDSSTKTIPDSDESLNIAVLNSGLNGLLRQLMDSPRMRSVVDVTGSLGFTPLYNACAGRNPVAVRILLESGADPDKPSERQHFLPLKKTVLANDFALSRTLLEFGGSACHCPRCNPLVLQLPVRPRIEHGEMDLLYLAFFTGPSVTRLLIAGGACLSPRAERVLVESQSADHCGVHATLYAAGHHRVLREVLSRWKGGCAGDLVVDDLRVALASPPTLRLLSRVVIRRAFGSRVHWAVQKIWLPLSIRDDLLLET